ncbi:Na+/H+ antiporter subunit E [Waddlia chondrophila]|uniref:Multiple resistance and pH homeostasis system, subunit E n=1 Tax=Waddlia chondrophila (strain ATCC VR-1470 / WSU 86-1044) TaxID=716544 RepID=D6YRH7_WADCW|nr:Na+/H+ antiporter subunit E [Waddlia chondrophila]ADI38672.1 multiple resistance and pH homeostasis system, subunit E [Waddlia chondrophila WSU 86-1044]
MRILRIFGFLIYYLKEIVIASLSIAWDILTPSDSLEPGVVEVPIDLKKEISIFALFNLISMTPGSLSLDYSADKKVIYVHVLYLHDQAAFIHKTKEELEKKIQLIFEP